MKSSAGTYRDPFFLIMRGLGPLGLLACLGLSALIFSSAAAGWLALGVACGLLDTFCDEAVERKLLPRLIEMLASCLVALTWVAVGLGWGFEPLLIVVGGWALGIGFAVWDRVCRENQP